MKNLRSCEQFTKTVKFLTDKFAETETNKQTLGEVDSYYWSRPDAKEEVVGGKKMQNSVTHGLQL